jgi:hypothetical protein
MVASTYNPMTIYEKISVRIIKEQELIIGPVAWDEAKKVSGFTVVNKETGEVALSTNSTDVVNRLVSQYERLFGRASHEVCKEAVQDLIIELKPEEIPSSLK